MSNHFRNAPVFTWQQICLQILDVLANSYGGQVNILINNILPEQRAHLATWTTCFVWACREGFAQTPKNRTNMYDRSRINSILKIWKWGADIIFHLTGRLRNVLKKSTKTSSFRRNLSSMLLFFSANVLINFKIILIDNFRGLLVGFNNCNSRRLCFWFVPHLPCWSSYFPLVCCGLISNL